jgi:hypothetical protein
MVAASHARRVERRALIRHSIDRAPRERLLGRDRIAGIEKLLRPGRSDEPRQAHGAVRRETAKTRFRERDPDAAARHTQVARKRQLETASDRRAVDRRDGRHRHPREPAQHHVLEQDLALARILVQLRELVDVAAGAEGASTAPMQDDATNIGGDGNVAQCRVEAAQQRGVHEVEWPSVERNLGDRPIDAERRTRRGAARGFCRPDHQCVPPSTLCSTPRRSKCRWIRST